MASHKLAASCCHARMCRTENPVLHGQAAGRLQGKYGIGYHLLLLHQIASCMLTLCSQRQGCSSAAGSHRGPHIPCQAGQHSRTQPWQAARHQKAVVCSPHNLLSLGHCSPRPCPALRLRQLRPAAVSGCQAPGRHPSGPWPGLPGLASGFPGEQQGPCLHRPRSAPSSCLPQPAMQQPDGRP